MAIYSHSRLSSFEQCPLKYKYRYIDKIIPDLEKSIEALLGTCVHEVLEWIYKNIKDKTPSLEEIILYYVSIWEQNYFPEIRIIKKGLDPKDYFNKGVQFLIDYYTKNYPFQDNTLEVERKILINLDEQGHYKIQGFIDRLVYNLEKNELEVHDYKTANSLPTQEKVDNDRQLALYAIAIKEAFGKEKEVKLIWHYLAYNKRIESKRTNQQLENLKKETIELIKQIESTTEFPTNKSVLCNWCEYKDICPVWSKQKELDIWN